MKRKAVKAAGRFLLTVCITTLLLMGVSVLTEGMYLIGMPDVEDVRSVTLSYPEKTAEIKTISDARQMELAVKASGFLRYALFEEADVREKPLITVTYFLDDGERVCVSANRDTVWWKGKAYAIQEKELFINVVEGIFFLEESMQEEAAAARNEA